MSGRKNIFNFGFLQCTNTNEFFVSPETIAAGTLSHSLQDRYCAAPFCRITTDCVCSCTLLLLLQLSGVKDCVCFCTLLLLLQLSGGKDCVCFCTLLLLLQLTGGKDCCLFLYLVIQQTKALASVATRMSRMSPAGSTLCFNIVITPGNLFSFTLIFCSLSSPRHLQD